MNNFMMTNVPAFIEKEMQAMTEMIKPQLKKSSRYSLIALPLLAISITNLFFSLISGGWTLDNMVILGIYALMAAVGIALFKESKHVKKEMYKIGMEHMIERINESEHVNDYSKEKYIRNIKAQPKFGMQTFFDFLTEENSRKERMTEN
ncbi:DUF5392 family protein [Virgibacillus siamensis]|uniref:DUF5392 family protein n=1 Tax=Virgibacillus siamensis TaxID=480071 RepID=UPI0009856475|nr:DUF5392 family protein [Virgibacillus siamensis]